jgi:outer membrane protein insertion porin family
VLKAAPGDQPDLLLTYRSNARAPLRLDLTRVRADEGGLLINPEGLFDRGTLVLDGREPSDGKLVFHAVARGIHADDPEEEAKKIDKAAKKLANKLKDTIARHDTDVAHLAGRTVTAIDIFGYKKTRKYVITREIRQRVGEPLDPAVVQKDITRLDNLSIFAQVRVAAREEEEGVRLEYQVKETPPVLPYPAMSFTEENGFSIGLGISAPNLTGRDITLSGRALFGGTTNYNAYFLWPWVPWSARDHFELGFFGAHVERRDDVRGFDETSDEFFPWVGRYLWGDKGRIKVGGILFRMQSDVPGITLSPDNDDQLHRIGFSLGWDSRDDWNLPHHGWLNEVQLIRTGGFLGGDGDWWTADFDVRRFQPINERDTLVLASLLTLQSGEAFVDVPDYMRYYVGGANSIRGYSVADSKTLSGKNQFLNTVEFRRTIRKPRRYDIIGLSFKLGLELAALADFGIAWDTSNQFAANRFRGGIGIGLRLLSPGAGMTRFDFAWSPEGGFQFHFGGASKMARSRFRIR